MILGHTVATETIVVFLTANNLGAEVTMEIRDGVKGKLIIAMECDGAVSIVRREGITTTEREDYDSVSDFATAYEV